MVVESYATVHQMVSSVVGELAEGRDLVDCLCALFPGGSMTGAPKVSAMGVIDETENVVRGIYSGCIGYLGLDGDADLDIVIRTVVLRGGRAYVNVGGAIVADSTVKGEHEESLLKARALLQAMANVEGP
jgi:para-aminobenzoate synthetase component 1